MKKIKELKNVKPARFIEKIRNAIKYIWSGIAAQNDADLEVRQAISGPVKFGMVVSVVVIGFFVLWSGFAPLDSAAIATGTVVSSSNRKTVQHLEGGIIADILVKEGDVVSIGQSLITLNHTSANARQELILGQLRFSRATEARLIAERDRNSEIIFDQDLVSNISNPDIKKIVDSQEQLFVTRRQSLNSQVDILNQKIEQFNEQLQGLNAQRRSTISQLELIKEEIKAKKILLDKGLVKKPEFLALKRGEADLEGEKGEYIANIARVRESITETKLQIISVKNEFDKEVVTELKEVQAKIADLKEQLLASSDVLKRTVITAPQNGVVTGMKYHTIGGVISPGAPIMDIVPLDDQMVIDAQVSITDIDVVHKGLQAKVMLSAYKARTVPRLDGEVIDVSADRFVDENTGMPYYKVRVEIDEGDLDKINDDVELYPGMPAEVFIITGESTFLNYLTDPITDSFRRSFKEQ